MTKQGSTFNAKCIRIDNSGQYFRTDAEHFAFQTIILAGIDRCAVEVGDKGTLTYLYNKSRGWYVFKKTD